jgi:hypothetical protein
MKNLSQSSRYKKFTHDRDAASELILQNTHRRITEILDHAFSELIVMVKTYYPDSLKHYKPLRLKLQFFDELFDRTLHPLGDLISREIIRMRYKVLTLAYHSENEAIRQSASPQSFPKLSPSDLHTLCQNQFKDVSNQITLELARLRHSLSAKIGISLMNDEPTEKAVGRVFAALPKKKPLPDKLHLKRVKHIEAPRPPQIFTQFLDKALAEQIINDYTSKYIFTDRSPENVFDIINPFTDTRYINKYQSKDAVYGWQVEQEITHDFVSQVRSGQIAAARDAGIKDFMWLAVLDSKTCEMCCAWRDGLTSSEILDKLNKDKDLKAACSALVPPAHMNCRCTPVPATDDIEYDLSDDAKDFHEWLYQNS